MTHSGTAVAGDWIVDGRADDDLAAAVEMRLGVVRIALPWAATETRPGALDGGVVEAWRARAEVAHSLGLRVWCALSAPDVPWWFENDGGFTDGKLAARAWPRWVDAAAQSVGDLVDTWVPLEAPFAMARRLVPVQPAQHGETMHHLVVAWRDAWRLLRGTAPVATSLDVRIVRAMAGPDIDPVHAAEMTRREDQLRWDLWLRAFDDGTVAIPGRADRELADLQGSLDILGLALRDDAEACLHRAAERGPGRPLAATIGLRGDSDQQRGEHLARQLEQCRRAASDVDLRTVLVVPWRSGSDGGIVDTDGVPTASGRVLVDAQPTGAVSNDSNANSAAPSNDASSPS